MCFDSRRGAVLAGDSNQVCLNRGTERIERVEAVSCLGERGHEIQHAARLQPHLFFRFSGILLIDNRHPWAANLHYFARAVGRRFCGPPRWVPPTRILPPWCRQNFWTKLAGGQRLKGAYPPRCAILSKGVNGLVFLPRSINIDLVRQFFERHE